jgi:hypothetical protein
MLGVVMRYYAGLPFNDYQQRFALTYSDMLESARFMAATASCELRHAAKLSKLPREGRPTYDWFIRKHGITSNVGRDNGSKSFLKLTYEWTTEQFEEFLRGASYVFLSEDWPGGYGGPSWAACCHYAAEWLAELRTNNGFAEPITLVMATWYMR